LRFLPESWLTLRTLFCALAVVLTVGYVVRVEQRLRYIEVRSDEMKTTWNSGGVQREVRTTQQAGETLAAWQDRHFALVRQKQADFPPDSE